MEGTMLINDLIKFLKKYFWIILLGALIGGIIGKLLIPAAPEPTYSASALVLIEKKEAELEAGGIIINQGDDMGRFLSTAHVLMKIPAILEKVTEELNLEESPKQLADMITVDNENNSQIFRITAQQNDPKKVTDIVNATAQAYSQELKQYLEDVDNVLIVQEAISGEENQILHTRSNATISMGVILGLVIGAFLAFAINILTNRKKYEN